MRLRARDFHPERIRRRKAALAEAARFWHEISKACLAEYARGRASMSLDLIYDRMYRARRALEE